jgi:lysophospholipase L1-like esterase
MQFTINGQAVESIDITTDEGGITMRLSRLGLGLGVLPVGGAAAVVSSISTMLTANRSAIDSQYSASKFSTITTGVTWGDSQTEGLQAIAEGGRAWPDHMGTWMTPAIENEGVGGETPTEIRVRAQAATAGQKAGWWSVMMGTNGVSPTASVTSTIIAEHTALIAAMDTPARAIVMPMLGSFQQGTGYQGYDQSTMTAYLESTYAERSVDLLGLLQRVGAPAATTQDAIDIRKGLIPQTLRAAGDATHLGYLATPYVGETMAAAFVGLAGGAPYPHHAEVTVRDGTASGAAVHTMARLGTVTAWEITGGSGADIVTIDSGGVIRSTGDNMTTSPLEVFVKATNASGSRYANVLIARGYASSETALGTNIGKYGALSGLDVFGTGLRTVTIVACIKVAEAMVDGCDVVSAGTNTTFRLQNNRRGRLTLRNSAGTLLVDVFPTRVATIGEWVWYAYSVDVDGGASAATGSAQAAGGAASTVAKVSVAGDIDLGGLMHLFTDGNGYSISDPLGCRYLWAGIGYLDMSSSTNRDLFYNSTTGLAVTPGAGGAIGGITPLIYMSGGPGDFGAGGNVGSHGTFAVNRDYAASLANYTVQA